MPIVGQAGGNPEISNGDTEEPARMLTGWRGSNN